MVARRQLRRGTRSPQSPQVLPTFARLSARRARRASISTRNQTLSVWPPYQGERREARHSKRRKPRVVGHLSRCGIPPPPTLYRVRAPHLILSEDAWSLPRLRMCASNQLTEVWHSRKVRRSEYTLLSSSLSFLAARQPRAGQKSTLSCVPRAVKCPSENPPTGARSSISP